MRSVSKISRITLSVILMMALGWLTISLPYVNAATTIAESSMEAGSEEEKADDNSLPAPFAGASEEKTETGGSTLSEYLHDHHAFPENVLTDAETSSLQQYDAYIAYHGELLTPPPEFPLV